MAVTPQMILAESAVVELRKPEAIRRWAATTPVEFKAGFQEMPVA
jgi:hypothetical protein